MQVVHQPGEARCQVQHCDRCGVVLGDELTGLPMIVPPRLWTEGVPVVQDGPLGPGVRFYAADEREPDCTPWAGPPTECYFWRPIPNDAPEPDADTLSQLARMLGQAHARETRHAPMAPPYVKVVSKPETWAGLTPGNTHMQDQMAAALRDNPRGLVLVAIICHDRR